MQGAGLRRSILFASAILAGFGATGAAAQTTREGEAVGVEPIVVTARRREENLQTTPVAVTAVTQETIEKRNLVSLEDLAFLVPNARVEEINGAIGSATLRIRGVVSGSNVVGQDDPIGMYIDGVVNPRNMVGTMDLVEPESVQVLRGPQGTLFGRNTTGGAILITSHTPTDEFSGRIKASYGTYDAANVSARVDTGLLGGSGIKLSVAHQHRQINGFEDNREAPDRLDPGAETSDAYWFKAVGDWSRFRVMATGDYTRMTGIPAMNQIVVATDAVKLFLANSPLYGGNTLPVVNSAMYSVPNFSTEKEQSVWSGGLGLTLEYDLNDSLKLKSVSGLRAYKRSDANNIGPSRLRGPLPNGRIEEWRGLYGFLDRQQSQRMTTQEVQILGDFGDFDFVGGLYYFEESAWDYALNRLPTVNATGTAATDTLVPRWYTVDSKSKAAFLQVDWRPGALDDKLEVSAGIRYTKDTRKFIELIDLKRTANLKTDDTSFLVGANYRWSDGLMTYLKYSTGYRAGGFNVRAAATVNPVYQPEKIKAWEAGFKWDGFDRRLRLNGAIFRNKYRGLQVTQFEVPGGGGAGGNLAINANAKYKGFELELVAVPVEGLTLTGSVGYTDSEYTNYPTALTRGAVVAGCRGITNAAGAVVGQDCAALADFVGQPKTTADLSASYVLPRLEYGEWSFSLSYSYVDSYGLGPVVDLSNTGIKVQLAQKDGYGLIGARIALSDIPLAGEARGELAVFGKNLSDKNYRQNGTDFGTWGTGTFIGSRTFGVEVVVNF